MKRTRNAIEVAFIALIAAIVMMPTAGVSQGGRGGAASSAQGQAGGVAQPIAPQLMSGDPNVHGTIKGIVKPPDSSQGIPDVQVLLRGSTSDPTLAGFQRSTITDAQGRFSFSDVPGGRYVLEGRRDGYFPAQLTVYVPVAVTPDLPNPQITIPLVAGGTISGILRDAQDRPVANVPVVPLVVDYWEGKRAYKTLNVSAGSQTTNDRGEYRLFGLPPGEYAVRTNAGIGEPSFQPASASVVPQLTYYPGTKDPSRAILLVVHSGEEITGIDFTPEYAPAFSVSGTVRVLVPGGKALANGQLNRSISRIIISPQNAGTVDSTSFKNLKQTSDANQLEFDFELRGVASGSYTLFPMFQAGSINYSTKIAVSVTDHDVTGLRGEIRTYPDVTFRVKTPSAKDVPRFSLSLRALDSLIGGGPVHQLRPDGFIVAPNLLPGRYRILPNTPMGFYLADIRQGQLSFYRDGILTATAENSDPIDLIFNSDGGEIHGTVRNSQGKPSAGEVVMVPQAPLRANEFLYKADIVSAANLQFTFKDIAPGEYKIFAWESPPPSGATKSEEYLSKYENRGRAVNISAGARTSDIVVDLIPNE